MKFMKNFLNIKIIFKMLGLTLAILGFIQFDNSEKVMGLILIVSGIVFYILSYKLKGTEKKDT